MVQLVNALVDLNRPTGGPQPALVPTEDEARMPPPFGQVISTGPGAGVIPLLGDGGLLEILRSSGRMTTGINTGAFPGDMPGRSGGFVNGLATNPLFMAGIEGLSGNNPLEAFRTGVAVQGRAHEAARQRTIRRQEIQKQQVLGAELAKIAEESGNPRLARLVDRGPAGFGQAIELVNLMAAAQAGRLTPEQEASLFRDEADADEDFESFELIRDRLGRMNRIGIRDGGATAVNLGPVGLTSSLSSDAFDPFSPDQPIELDLGSLGAAAQEAGPQALGGFLDALENTADTFERAVPLGTFDIVEGRLVHRPVDPAAERGFPAIAPAETTGGDLVRGVSQFLTGFFPALKGAQLLKIGKAAQAGAKALGAGGRAAHGAGSIAEAEAAALAGGQLAFDPSDPNLINLLTEHTDLRDPVLEFLATDPGDSEAENRLGNGLVDLGLGAFAGPLVEIFKGFRRARSNRSFVVAEGEIRPASELAAYVEEIVKANRRTGELPRFLFDTGVDLAKPIVDRAAALRPMFGELTGRRILISNRVVEKLYRNSPTDADRLLSSMRDLLSAPREVLPDHQTDNRILLTRPFVGQSGKAKNQVGVLEIAMTRTGMEVVSIHISPDRTLEKARSLLRRTLRLDDRATNGGAG